MPGHATAATISAFAASIPRKLSGDRCRVGSPNATQCETTGARKGAHGMSDRTIAVYGMVAVALLCVLAVVFELSDLESGVTERTQAALDDAGVGYESVSADGRIAKVILPVNASVLDQLIRAVVDDGFLSPTMRVDIERSGPMITEPSPTTTSPPPPTTTEPVVPVKSPELRLEVVANRVTMLDGRVGGRSDTAALAARLGPPNGWNLDEDPATLNLPSGALALIDVVGDDLAEGEIRFSDGILIVTGTTTAEADIARLRRLLTAGGTNFTVSHQLIADPSAIEAAIIEVTRIDGITFDSGTANINEAGRLVLDDITAILIADPNLSITIEGHTDSFGDPDRNLQLSLARAMSVAQYLVTAGIDEAALTPVGSGDSQPVGDNETPEGRAANRRIEFIVSRRGIATP